MVPVGSSLILMIAYLVPHIYSRLPYQADIYRLCLLRNKLRIVGM